MWYVPETSMRDWTNASAADRCPAAEDGVVAIAES
jgi:hypothetical protein